MTWLSVKVKNNSLKLLLYWFFKQKRSYFSSMKCLFNCLTLISWIIYLLSFFHCTKKFRSITKQSRCSKHQDNIRHHLTNVIQKNPHFGLTSSLNARTLLTDTFVVSFRKANNSFQKVKSKFGVAYSDMKTFED